MFTKERDIVLRGRDGGEDTIDLPVTRLGNIESGAEVKEAPDEGDYLPLIDSGDNEQMKKISAKILVDAKATADRALLAVQRVGYVVDTLPYQTTALTFTGEEQSPTWGAFDPGKLEISGVTSGVNAGEYEATFIPKGDYIWADETTEPKTVKWSIGRAAVAVPTVAGSLTYTGAAQSPAWTGYDGEKMEIGGDTSAVNAGSYQASFTPKANYQWSDGTTDAKTVGWSIGKAVISAVPSQAGSLTYNGGAQSPGWANYDPGKLTIGGTTSAVNAGSYYATFTPKENYIWAGGHSEPASAGWSIGKAAGSLTLDKTAMALGISGMTGVITVSRAGTGAITASSSNPAVAEVAVNGNMVTVTAKASGAAAITVSAGADGNYNAPASQTCQVTITLPSSKLNDNSWETIRAVSDAGQAANYWAVGATKQITLNGTRGGKLAYSNLAVDVFIIGINHNVGREGGDRIHFQLGKMDGIQVGFGGTETMNPWHSNEGGWAASPMRSSLGNNASPTSPTAGSFMALLPADLRAVMKSCVKYTSNNGWYGGTQYVTATTDYLFLLSTFEVYGTSNEWDVSDTAEQSFQAQYAYYAAGNTRIFHAYENPTQIVAATWLRSLVPNTHLGSDDEQGEYCCTSNSETYGSMRVSEGAMHVAPAFCV